MPVDDTREWMQRASWRAGLIGAVESGDRALVARWGGALDGDVLSEISKSICEEVIKNLPRGVLVDAIRDLDTEGVIDILEDLGALDADDRTAVAAALA